MVFEVALPSNIYLNEKSVYEKQLLTGVNLVAQSTLPALGIDVAVFEAGMVKIQIKEKGDYQIFLEFQNEKGQTVKKEIMAKVDITNKVVAETADKEEDKDQNQ